MVWGAHCTSASLDDLEVLNMYKRLHTKRSSYYCQNPTSLFNLHVEDDYCIILFSGRLNQLFKTFSGAEELADAMCSPYHLFKYLDGVKKALEKDLDNFQDISHNS